MVEINETHDPLLKSWVPGADDPNTDFPVQNLPFGMYRIAGKDEDLRACTAIGDYVFDLAGVDVGFVNNLNDLASAGQATWSGLRSRLSKVLAQGSKSSEIEKFLVPLNQVELGLPVQCGDYTDYFTSYYHAYNAGKLFRPDAPLTPNFKWMPIAYHGRASSVVSSGTPVRRPRGQTMQRGDNTPVLTPSAWLDYEVELGVIIGPGNDMGNPISIDDAEDHVFGLTVLNDWSARDIQAWEYQPLGPFLAKNFATTLSPWVVTMEALAPFRAPSFKRFAGDPDPLPYLTSEQNIKTGGLDIIVEAAISRGNSDLIKVSKASYQSSYWNLAQMVAHHTISGCPLSPGDILGTGTISGADPEGAGALLELTKAGTNPISLGDKVECTFLEDGDTVSISAQCRSKTFKKIGFGAATGLILPANQ
jgi:fumarylacetoacetase